MLKPGKYERDHYNNSNYNVINENNPLIKNTNEYMIVNKIISIHSEDRDILQFPSSNFFEITLPDNYTNIITAKLGSYAFPSNYNVFSLDQNNILLSFQINEPYNPADHGYYDPILDIIYQALYYNRNQYFYSFISDGYYTPDQIASELMNRMNDTVNNFILEYMKNNNPTYIDEFINNGGYNQFVVVYNLVSQSLWFGNKSSKFIITNNDPIYSVSNSVINTIYCKSPDNIPYNINIDDFSNWGLPYYLGFTRCPIESQHNTTPGSYPRFYYGDALTTSDNGYWLIPDPSYNTKNVYFLESPGKINLLGEAYIYMELNGLNYMDETIPFGVENTFLNTYTNPIKNNRGDHNSAFAKIAVASTPISQIYDTNTESITVFNPPIERLSKIKVKFRYHNGRAVNFGNFNYSFNLIFEMLVPQILRSYTTFNPSASSTYGSSSLTSKK